MFDANRPLFTVYFFVFVFVLHLPRSKYFDKISRDRAGCVTPRVTRVTLHGCFARTSGRVSDARATPAPVAATPSFSDPPSSTVPSGPGPSACKTPAPRSAGADGSLETDPVQTVPSRRTPRRSSVKVARGANWLPVEDLAACLAQRRERARAATGLGHVARVRHHGVPRVHDAFQGLWAIMAMDT